MSRCLGWCRVTPTSKVLQQIQSLSQTLVATHQHQAHHTPGKPLLLFSLQQRFDMTAGRKLWLTAQGIITSPLHHQQSEPGSLVIPILIYTQNRDILHKQPEVTGACTAGLNSVFVSVQVLWSSGLGLLRQWGQCLSSGSVPTPVSV